MGGFRKGDRVEVRSEELGFLGSWYEATVVRKGAKACQVKYRTLVGESTDEPLMERVLISNMRPLPPAVAGAPGGKYDEGDAIEAYDRDGWWVGIVHRVIGEDRYVVYFRESCEEVEYSASQLRFRQDWHNGIWIRVYEKRNPCLEAYRKIVARPSKLQVRGLPDDLKRRVLDTTGRSQEQEPSLDSEQSDDEDKDHDPANNPGSKSPSDAVDDQDTFSFPISTSPASNSKNSRPCSSSSPGTRANRLASGTNLRLNLSDSESPVKQSEGRKRARSLETCRLRRIQMKAYSSVLRAFHLKGGGLTWQQEQLISDLRCQLQIDNDVHIKQLESLADWELRCDCSRCS